MADPSIRLSGSDNKASMGTALSLAPGGTPASGETILIIVAGNESPAFSTPSVTGFSTVASITSADFTPLYVLGKIAGGSEGTSYSLTWSGGAKDGGHAGVILVFQNANASLPTNTATAHDTTASTTYTFPGITIANNGGYDLVIVASDGNIQNPSYSSWSNSLVELFDVTDTTNGYANLGVAGVTRAASGAQSAGTVTGATNDKNVAIRIEVEPAAAGAAGQPTQKRMGGVPFMGQHGAGFPSAIQRW